MHKAVTILHFSKITNIKYHCHSYTIYWNAWDFNYSKKWVKWDSNLWPHTLKARIIPLNISSCSSQGLRIAPKTQILESPLAQTLGHWGNFQKVTSLPFKKKTQNRFYAYLTYYSCLWKEYSVPDSWHRRYWQLPSVAASSACHSCTHQTCTTVLLLKV